MIPQLVVARAAACLLPKRLLILALGETQIGDLVERIQVLGRPVPREGVRLPVLLLGHPQCISR
jgi:hypothetical protein